MPTITATGADVGAALGSFLDQIIARVEQMRVDVNEAAAKAMDESMQAGVDVAHERIESAVTPTGLREHPAHPGRVDTGAFDDEFEHHTYQLDKDRMQGRIGWIAEDTAPEANAAGGKSYFELQDQGFTTQRGVDVAGVHALLDATTVAKETFKERLTEYVEANFK